ncbi:MAG: hypothetical protein K8U57_35780 [Planctomycetes bacterium]|nr:hypothetical protein [Planctomycetota bacterium]
MGWRTQVAGEPEGFAKVWCDRCTGLGQAVCELLQEAGLPVTRENVLAMLDGMPVERAWPDDSLLARCMDVIPADRRASFAQFFHGDVASLKPSTARMLIDSLRGVLEGVTFDADLPLAVEIEPEI